MPSENYEELNERKNHYQIIDDDTIQSLVRYYKLEHDKEVLKFIKGAAMKGDTL